MTPNIISIAPKMRGMFISLTATPSKPKWSITSVISICPAITRLNVKATPRRGTSETVAVTKNAPNIPPVQAIADAFFADARFPKGTPVARIYMKSAIVPTANETKPARIGLSIVAASLLLIAACVGIIIPANTARTMKK